MLPQGGCECPSRHQCGDCPHLRSTAGVHSTHLLALRLAVLFLLLLTGMSHLGNSRLMTMIALKLCRRPEALHQCPDLTAFMTSEVQPPPDLSAVCRSPRNGLQLDGKATCHRGVQCHPPVSVGSQCVVCAWQKGSNWM